MREGDSHSLDQANAALNLAGELDSKDARVIDGLGSLAFKKGNYNLAEKYFYKAIFTNPRYARAYGNMALLKQVRKQPEKAISYYKQGLLLDPHDYKMRTNYALFLASRARTKGQLRTSYNELLKAKQLAPAGELDTEVAEIERRLR